MMVYEISQILCKITICCSSFHQEYKIRKHHSKLSTSFDEYLFLETLISMFIRASFVEFKKNSPSFAMPHSLAFVILAKFERKKMKETNTSLGGSSKWQLFYKVGIQWCVFAWEFEVFWIVKPQLEKKAILLKAEAH